MKSCFRFIFLLLLILLSGCTQSVKQSLMVERSTKTNIGNGKTVVILPFADYSYGYNLENLYKRNLIIQENIIDNLVQNGFRVPIQEDVFMHLADQEIIQVVDYSNRKTISLEREMDNDWSPVMKRKLQQYIDQVNKGDSTGSSIDHPIATHGLTAAEIINIGQRFGAEYVIRGQILQNKMRQENYWAPWKKGVVGFVAGVTNKVFFGQASAAQYDDLGYDNDNMIYYAGDIPQAVVQVRIWVQDASSGSLIWTNRVDIKTSPQSVLADYQYDALFERATEEAIGALMVDFMYSLQPSPTYDQVIRKEYTETYKRRDSKSTIRPY